MGEAILAKGNRPVDSVPTSGSTNLITSGAVAEAISEANEIHIGSENPSGNEVFWINANAVTNTSKVYNKVVNVTPSYALLSDSTIFVSMSGNDETGDGSADAPFRSINHAISMLPKNLNGFNATIMFDSYDIEIFDEVVKLAGFYGGELIFRGSDETNLTSCKISKINVTNCTLVRFLNLYLYSSGLTQSNSNIYVENSNINVSNVATGIELKAVSHFITDEKTEVNINECTVAVNTMELSKMYIYQISGTNIHDGIIADSGSVVNITRCALDVVGTLYTTSSGSTISINAQSTIANC